MRTLTPDRAAKQRAELGKVDILDREAEPDASGVRLIWVKRFSWHAGDPIPIDQHQIYFTVGLDAEFSAVRQNVIRALRHVVVQPCFGECRAQHVALSL